MMMNITFAYRDLSDDVQEFNWLDEMQLIHETEARLEDWLGVCQAAATFLSNPKTWWMERTYLDICSAVEGIDGVRL